MLNHIINSLLLGIGLSADTFSISLVNGISYPETNKNKLISQSLIFGACQGIMPFIGYILLVYFSSKLAIIKTVSPYISLVLLSYLGIKLIIESFKKESIKNQKESISLKEVLIQGIATSIDAVSCSFSMIDLNLSKATIEVLIISIVTIIVSYTALHLGKEIGNRIEKYSKIIGGVILIIIGIMLFIGR